MGLRVTDTKTINIVESVMTEFNKEIVKALEKKSCKAKSITIKKNNIIYVEQENKELGYVGKPTRVDSKILKEIITAIPPLRVTGISWNAWGFEKSLSSKAPLFILCEYLLTRKKIKKINLEQKH